MRELLVPSELRESRPKALAFLPAGITSPVGSVSPARKPSSCFMRELLGKASRVPPESLGLPSCGNYLACRLGESRPKAFVFLRAGIARQSLASPARKPSSCFMRELLVPSELRESRPNVLKEEKPACSAGVGFLVFPLSLKQAWLGVKTKKPALSAPAFLLIRTRDGT